MAARTQRGWGQRLRWLVAGLLAAIAMCAALVGLSTARELFCHEERAPVTSSPDGRYVAWAEYQDCVNARGTIYLSVMVVESRSRSWSVLDQAAGTRVFRLFNGELPDVALRWASPTELVIAYETKPWSGVDWRESSWGDVEITYQERGGP